MQTLAKDELIIKLVLLAAENKDGSKVYKKFRNEDRMSIKGYGNGVNGVEVAGGDEDGEEDGEFDGFYEGEFEDRHSYTL